MRISNCQSSRLYRFGRPLATLNIQFQSRANPPGGFGEHIDTSDPCSLLDYR